MKKTIRTILCVMLCALAVINFASCDKKEADGGSGDEINNEAVNGGEDVGGDGETSADGEFTLEVSEEKDCFIWKITDNTYWKIYHDGKNVTGFETWILNESAEDAKLLSDSFQALAAAEDSGMKKIYSEGRYLVYEYTEENFPVHTYDEAKEAYEAAKALG